MTKGQQPGLRVKTEIIQAMVRTNIQATAGTSMQAVPTAGTSTQATVGTSMQATASTSLQAIPTAGTNMQATVCTIFHETASTSTTHHPRLKWGTWTARGLRRNAVVPAPFQELHVKSGQVVKTAWGKKS